MSIYLVTGGAGFIGSNLVDALLAQGAQVRVADNFSTGKRHNLAHVAGKIELLEGDLSNLDFARAAVQGVDYVLHQAAIPSVPRSVDDPIYVHNAGVNATLNVLVAARDAKVKRMTYASSSSVYGEALGDGQQAKREDMLPMPLSPYGVSKLAGEQYCLAFYQVYGFEVVPLRYFNVFGGRQDPTSDYAAVIPKFVTMMQKGASPTIHGDGEQTRDFTYIANVVAANLFMLHTPGVAGQAYNAAMGKSTSLNELVDMLNEVMGTDVPAKHGPARNGDIRHSYADISKIKSVGFLPQVDLLEGLRRTAEWYANR
ncbi:MAG TPA: SDR family oxidoreductase [Anaerolineales bacterium]|nr:SDR family oxidoreductase [Anaerolineales bacterium]